VDRELPAELSEAQRWVLRDFFDGRIPAGQLTQRLGIDARAQQPERHLPGVADVPPGAGDERDPQKRRQSRPAAPGPGKDLPAANTGAAAA
jgi:hypothetical protein